MAQVSRVQVMAHRGASRAEQENTLAAFRRAGEMGAHAVELDVRRRSDGVLVEIKNDPEEPDFDATESIADETLAHLLARNEDDRWLISCFRMETVDRCRALAPQIKTAWLCVQAPEGIAATLVKKGHLAVHPWVKTLTRDTIDACHAAGVQVNTWTCDDPARMAELIEWGIDGICTNEPDVALGVLGR